MKSRWQQTIPIWVPSNINWENSKIFHLLPTTILKIRKLNNHEFLSSFTTDALILLLCKADFIYVLRNNNCSKSCIILHEFEIISENFRLPPIMPFSRRLYSSRKNHTSHFFFPRSLKFSLEDRELVYRILVPSSVFPHWFWKSEILLE